MKNIFILLLALTYISTTIFAIENQPVLLTKKMNIQGYEVNYSTFSSTKVDESSTTETSIQISTDNKLTARHTYFDIKLGIFGTQNTNNEISYLGFPEFSIGLGSYNNENHLIFGGEFNSYSLPKYTNLWGNTLGVSIPVTQIFMNIGWLKLSEKESHGIILGLGTGYMNGLFTIGSGEIAINSGPSCKLVLTKGFRPTRNSKTCLTMDIGIQYTVGYKVFMRFGALII